MRARSLLAPLAILTWVVTAVPSFAQTAEVTSDSTADPATIPAATPGITPLDTPGEPTATPAPIADTTAPRPALPSIADAPAAVLDEGRSVWVDVLQPTLARLTGVVPTLAKALLVLLLFWIVAGALGTLVRRGLALTRLDDRAARELGLDHVLKTDKDRGRSVAHMAGETVKWIVLLFGFVAFFQVLDLEMVATPLQSVADKILSVAPRLLQAALILLAYWVVASLVRFAVVRGLGALKFDEWSARFLRREGAEGRAAPTTMAGRLAFYVILAFGLPPFLDALGQSALVAPLAGMLERIFEFVPNVIVAVVILLLGRIVASVVREIVVNFLAALGADAAAERLGLSRAVGAARLSEIGGAAAYFFVFLPVIAAAVESLRIRALSEPIAATLERLFAAIPMVIVALLVVGVGVVLARMVRDLVENLLRSLGFDELPEKLGLDFLRPREGRPGPSVVGGLVVFVIIVVLTVQQALDTLHLTQLSALVARLIGFLPELIVGLALVLASIALAGAVGRIVQSAAAGNRMGSWLATAARVTILFVGISMGLTELGVGADIVRIAVSAALGGAALALGLAFGLGGRDRAREFLETMRK